MFAKIRYNGQILLRVEGLLKLWPRRIRWRAGRKEIEEREERNSLKKIRGRLKVVVVTWIVIIPKTQQQSELAGGKQGGLIQSLINNLQRKGWTKHEQQKSIIEILSNACSGWICVLWAELPHNEALRPATVNIFLANCISYSSST